MKERVNRGDIGRAQPCMGLFGSFWYSCIFLRYPSQLNHLIESLNWITWGEAGWSQFSRSLEIESISADLAQTRHGFCCPAGMCPINHKVGGLCFDGSPISLLCFCDLVRLPSCWMAEMFDLHQFPEFDPHLHSILRCPRYSAVFAMFFWCFFASWWLAAATKHTQTGCLRALRRASGLAGRGRTHLQRICTVQSN